MNGAIVYRWGTPVRGREGRAIEVFGRALEHFDALAKAGRIHGHTELFSVTGSTRGLMIVSGELGELSALQIEEEQLRLLFDANAVVEDLDVQLFQGGDEHSIAETVQRFAVSLDSLGYL